jgi:hypothetical protein
MAEWETTVLYKVNLKIMQENIFDLRATHMKTPALDRR